MFVRCYLANFPTYRTSVVQTVGIGISTSSEEVRILDPERCKLLTAEMVLLAGNIRAGQLACYRQGSRPSHLPSSWAQGYQY